MCRVVLKQLVSKKKNKQLWDNILQVTLLCSGYTPQEKYMDCSCKDMLDIVTVMDCTVI